MARIIVHSVNKHYLTVYEGDPPAVGMGMVILDYPNDSGEVGELVGVVESVIAGMTFSPGHGESDEVHYQITLKAVHWRPAIVAKEDSNVPAPTP